LYRGGDIPAFQAAPGWNEQFVGIGPYRVAEYSQGSPLVAEAFDKYFLGRPKIDRLVLNWVEDPNLIVTKVLAGAADIVMPGANAYPEQLAEIRRQWGPSKGVVEAAPNDIRVLYLNFREGPWSKDLKLRQAMLTGINR